MIKKILIPTDFSDLGNYAYGIANVIAKGINAEIMTLSIVPGPQGAIYSKSGGLINDEGEDYTEWNKKLDESKKKMEVWISDKSNVSNSMSVIGNVDRAILQCIESNEIDLIVMGTDGLFDKSLWSKGSHTEYISNHSSVPVLSLKCDRTDVDLKEIVLVGDFLEIEKFDLSIIKSIQKANNSKLLLLKVNTENQQRTDEQIANDMKAFALLNNLENYEMHTFHDASVEGGIGKFCAEKNIDLIAIGTHQKVGFSKMFRGSISDDVVNHLFHPILTFPLN